MNLNNSAITFGADLKIEKSRKLSANSSCSLVSRDLVDRGARLRPLPKPGKRSLRLSSETKSAAGERKRNKKGKKGKKDRGQKKRLRPPTKSL